MSVAFSERLWSGIAVGAPDECWPWQRYVNEDGYGMLRLSAPNADVRVLAHRAVFVERNGLLSPGEIPRHTCDNPPCCNYGHLVRGTKSDNSLDCVARGRHARSGGYKKPEDRAPLVVGPPTSSRDLSRVSPLSREDVILMRLLRSEGLSLRVLGRQFSVNPATVHNIVTGKTWR